MKAVKIILVLSAVLMGVVFGLYPSAQRAQVRTVQKDDPSAEWDPMREAGKVKYVGSQTCIQCHSKDAQLDTPMAHATQLPADSEILKKYPALKFRNGAYSYEISRQGPSVIYTVSDGLNKISEPVAYCFGQGQKGQVYIFYHNGQLYESRVTFYQTLQNLDFTIAQPHDVPGSLESALGRQIPPAEAQNCFSCHSTGAIKDKQLRIADATPGVNCEVCHGPGGNHLAAFKARDMKNLHIFNPAKLDPFELSQQFCAACHVGFEKVLNMPKGTDTVRFQPYRLFSSEKHDTTDARLSCIACHNPHEKTPREPAYYDAKCFACHLSSSKEAKTPTRSAPPCPVATQKCVTCHMPKTEVPEMHFKFTDHQIRIVKPAKQ
ncbi:MAG: multiheme c-type cytochrome [Acidobacteriota bacterium]